MPAPSFTYKIYPQHFAVIAKAVGELLVSEMINFMFNLCKDPEYQQGMNSFYDLTECTGIVGDLKEVEVFSQMLNDKRFVLKQSKTSLLIANNNTTVLRMIQGLVLMSSESKIEHKYFQASDIKLALEFVNFTSEFVLDTPQLNHLVQHDLQLPKAHNTPYW